MSFDITCKVLEVFDCCQIISILEILMQGI